MFVVRAHNLQALTEVDEETASTRRWSNAIHGPNQPSQSTDDRSRKIHNYKVIMRQCTSVHREIVVMRHQHNELHGNNSSTTPNTHRQAPMCHTDSPSPYTNARQYSSGDCLEVKREYYQNSSVLDCVTQCSQSAAHLCEQFLQVKQIGFVTLGPLHCA